MVLTLLTSWYPNDKLSLQKLSMKMATLLALVTAHRLQTLALVDIRNIRKIGQQAFEIMIPDQIKTSGPNRKQPLLLLPFFLEDKSICPATTLEVYLKRTEKMRLNTEKLFVSFKKPHGAIGSQTLSRWIKATMSRSGINIEKFSAYSTRHAATLYIIKNL